MTTDKQPGSADNRLDRGEFVAASPHAKGVAAAVAAIGVDCTDTQSSSRRLDLSLLTPRWREDSGQTLRQAVVARTSRPDAGRLLDLVPPPREPGVSRLDDLMFCIRYDHAARYDGWVPTMGKNRTVQNVTGQPHIDGGSADVPDPHIDGGSAGDPDPHIASAAAAVAHAAGEQGRVRVGILDTPLFPNPKLLGHYLADADDLLPADRPVYSRYAGHATFIAGLILQRARGAELEVRRTLDEEHAQTTLWDLVHHMLDMRDAGVQVLNLSLGCFTRDRAAPMVLERAVRLLAPDTVIVAAAGNHGDLTEDEAGDSGINPRTPFWPAALDDVVAVGADRGSAGELAAFSPSLPWITFTAKGVELVSTYLKGLVYLPGRGNVPFDGRATWSGTSFAAATVSGELAALTRRGESAWDALDRLTDQAAHKPDSPVRLFTMPSGA